MDIKNQINYWLSSADNDLATAKRLFSTGDFHWCLFIAHLALEKALKAYYCHINQDTPPRIHDLVKLSRLAKLELSEDQILFYNRINDFNIEARYPDQKFSFYQIATKEFSEDNFNKIKSEFKWIKSLIT